MTERDKLLILTVCELFEKSFKPAQIEQAFERAKRRLDRPNHPPRPAKVTHAIRRDVTE
jgi:hypothetical protein